MEKDNRIKLLEAESLIEKNQYLEANKILDKLIEQNPNNLEAINDLAVIKLNLQEYTYALNLITSILIKEPNNFIAINNLQYFDEQCLQSAKSEHRFSFNIQKCNLCEHNGYHILTKKSHPYYMCSNCGVVFTPQIDSKLLMTKNNGDIGRNHPEAMDTRLVRIKTKHNGIITTIVDFGCGNGQFSNFLLKKGFNVFSIDRDTEIQLENIENNSIDVIILIEVIEHINMPLPLFHKFEKILKEKGIIYIESSFVSSANLETWEYLDPSIDHSFIHSEKSINILADICGFEIEKINNNTYIFMKN